MTARRNARQNNNPALPLFIGSMFGGLCMILFFNFHYNLTPKTTSTKQTATSTASEKYDVVEGIDHTWHVVKKIADFEVVRTADAWALYKRGGESTLFVDVIATASEPSGLETLKRAKALYRAYGNASSLPGDMKEIEPRIKGLKVSMSEVPGKDFVTTSTTANAIDLARIAIWYWAPSKATRLPE